MQITIMWNAKEQLFLHKNNLKLLRCKCIFLICRTQMSADWHIRTQGYYEPALNESD